MFDVNVTLIIQLINFILTVVVLNYLLIKPIRGIVKKRRDLASDMLSAAENFTEDAEGKLKTYETALGKAREEAAAARAMKKNEGASRGTELLEAARREACEYLQSSREETRDAVAEAMAALEKRVPDLARMTAARLLGKTGRAPAA